MNVCNDKDCPFCLLPDKHILKRSACCVMFYDKYPVSPGHVLIVPTRHESDYFNLKKEEKIEIWDLVETAKEYIESRFHPEGYNVGINIGEPAGQSVFHVHVHIIPRYKGDVPSPKGGIRGVIPEKQKY